jgi:hypothetical protein
LFRKGEILPDGRTNQDEEALVRAGLPNKAAVPVNQQQQQQQQTAV